MLEAIVRKRWESQGVKFDSEPFRWVKTLRVANCVFCHTRSKEKSVDDTFSQWAILSLCSTTQGKAPEVCPECLSKLHFAATTKVSRTAACTICGESQREKIYGIGFPGWSALPSLNIIGKPRRVPLLCPNCSLEVGKKLGPRFIRSTWTDLDYPPASLLTSTKMAQNQDNFQAMAQQHEGAPELKLQAVKNFSFITTQQFSSDGQGSLVVDYEGIKVTNMANYTRYALIRSQQFGGTLLSFDEKLTFICRTEIECDGGTTFYWSIGDLPIWDRSFFGFYLDGYQMRGYNGDGSTKQTTLWTYGSAGTYTEVLKAVLNPGSSIDFYRGGTLVGTSSENIPTGDFPWNYNCLCVAVYRYGQSKTNKVHSWVVIKEDYTES